MTQIEMARRGVITPEMEYVAKREDLEPELIRAEVARGRMVIPANKVHLAKSARADVHRHRRADQDQRQYRQLGRHQRHPRANWKSCTPSVHFGADTVMDLSTGRDIDAIRQAIIDASPVPIGTVPMYQMVQNAGRHLRHDAADTFSTWSSTRPGRASTT